MAVITTYHGTQQSFDRPDAEFFGEGGGRSMYGRGLYVAEHVDYAREHLQSRIDDPLVSQTDGGVIYEIDIEIDDSRILESDVNLTTQDLNRFIEGAEASGHQGFADNLRQLQQSMDAGDRVFTMGTVQQKYAEGVTFDFGIEADGTINVANFRDLVDHGVGMKNSTDFYVSSGIDALHFSNNQYSMYTIMNTDIVEGNTRVLEVLGNGPLPAQAVETPAPAPETNTNTVMEPDDSPEMNTGTSAVDIEPEVIDTPVPKDDYVDARMAFEATLRDAAGEKPKSEAALDAQRARYEDSFDKIAQNNPDGLTADLELFQTDPNTIRALAQGGLDTEMSNLNGNLVSRSAVLRDMVRDNFENPDLAIQSPEVAAEVETEAAAPAVTVADAEEVVEAAEDIAEEVAEATGDIGSTPDNTLSVDASDIEPENAGGILNSIGKYGGAIAGAAIGAGVGVYTYMQTSDAGEAFQATVEMAVPYGETGYDIAEGDMDAAIHSATVETAANIGGAGAALAGGAAGAAIGTAIMPVVGTAVGAVAGGIIGGVGGGVAVGAATDYVLENGAEIIDSTMDVVDGATTAVVEAAQNAKENIAQAAADVGEDLAQARDWARDGLKSAFNWATGSEEPENTMVAEAEVTAENPALEEGSLETAIENNPELQAHILAADYFKEEYGDAGRGMSFVGDTQLAAELLNAMHHEITPEMDQYIREAAFETLPERVNPADVEIVDGNTYKVNTGLSL